MSATTSGGSVDINLTALITSVERDIWLLEQLESNSSRRRRNLPTDELPFPVTEEILNLPGYKPRTRPLKLSGRWWSCLTLLDLTKADPNYSWSNWPVQHPLSGSLRNVLAHFKTFTFFPRRWKLPLTASSNKFCVRGFAIFRLKFRSIRSFQKPAMPQKIQQNPFVRCYLRKFGTKFPRKSIRVFRQN